MLGILLSEYRTKLRCIENIIKNEELTDVRFLRLFRYLKYFKLNMKDLINNHNEVYLKEFKPIILNAIEVHRLKRVEMEKEILDSDRNKQKQNLVKAMKKYSRWIINDIATKNKCC